ncbi:MAG TPA: hypothetical protein VEL07_20255 [Planctomycetota bacterium]|nr:hypothetical protein [Planctomycetota bacterium]
MLDTLDLGGAWRLTFTDHERFGRPGAVEKDRVDEYRYIDATVPGEVHLDAWRAGLIADPYVGTNALAARWVEECEWSYRRFIDVPAAACAGRAWLRFECLDLVARINLNGVEIATHANSFLPCRIDVTGKLKPGPNLLVVHLESGLYDAADKSASAYGASPAMKLSKRHWLRKVQSQAGWDWSPRLYNIGIQGPVRLEWTADAARLDRLVPLATISDDQRTGRLKARVFVEGLGTEAVAARVRVELPASRQSREIDIQAKPGLHAYEVELSVAGPRLWWPVGHGAQPLEAVVATLSVAGAEIGRDQRRIGWRSIAIDQSPHPEGGRHFIVVINGRRIFCKGGNFVPADIIRAAIDRKRYEALVDRALEANFNLLRVWGGGLYESDDFYDLCDERGILVWQEFIFACGRYPGNDERFYASVRDEATHQIRRLASHASLFAWCGNNENEWGYWEWGFHANGQAMPCHQLYHHLFPRLLGEEDPTRWYQPSSPWSPDHLRPNRDDVGDQHPWSVGFAETDFRKYRAMTCRFPNEGGFLGPVSLPTTRDCLPDGQRRVHSWAWQAHDNSIASWHAHPTPTDAIPEQWLGRRLADMTLEDSIYWLGLVQGEALREYCENFRRRMFSSAAAVFWMYNDCWAATRSWTIVDHGLRRTPAFHPVRRALAPIALAVVADGAEIVVYGMNDTREAVAADLRCGVCRLAGGWPVDRRTRVTLAANASTALARFPAAEWTDVNASLACAMLEHDGRTIARARLVQPFFKELAWPAARPRVELKDGIATFTSDTFAWGVCIDLDGEAVIADNFFDLWPGVPYAIPWHDAQAPRIVRIGNLHQVAVATG